MLTITTVVRLPQGGGTEYDTPAQAVGQLHHPRLVEQLEKLTAAKDTATKADTNWQKAKTPGTGPVYDTYVGAYENLHGQLLDTVDLAAATAGTAKQHAQEQYRLNAARYERARQQMLTALHECAVHANMLAAIDANPASLGVDKRTRDPLFHHVQALASEVEQLKLRPISD